MTRVRFVRLAGLALGLLGAMNHCSAVASTPTAEQSWETIQKIVNNRGLSPGWVDTDGRSSISYHLRFGTETEAVRLIRQARLAKIEVRDRNALAYASVQRGRELALKELLDSGVSPNTIFAGESLLMVSAREGQLGIMRLLLAKGANVDYRFKAKAQDTGASDAVTYALEAGKYHAMRLLFDSGYRVSKTDPKHADELLFSAIAGGSSSSVAFLLQSTSNVHAMSSDGETALTFAVRSEASDQLVSELLLRGAEPCKLNKAGVSVSAIVEKINLNKQSWEKRYSKLESRLACTK